MHRLKTGLLALLGGLAFTSCGHDGAPTKTAEPGKVPATADSVFESPGKPNVQAVEVSYRLLGTPAIGQPLDIELTMISSGPAASSHYRLSAQEGLVVDPGFDRVESVSAEAFIPHKEIVTITPVNEGRHYLTVIASAVVNGAPTSQQVLIPIQVGAGSRELQQIGEIRIDQDGNPVVSLPAATPD